MNPLNLIIILENYFIIKILELFIPKIKINHLVSICMTLLLSLEGVLLSYTNIGENEKLIIPIITVLLFCIMRRTSIISASLKIIIAFLNLTLVKVIVITISTLIIGSSFETFYNDYMTMFVLTCISIIALGLEYLLLKEIYDSTFKLSKYSIITLSLCSIITFIVVNVILREYVMNSISFIFCVGLVSVLIFFLLLVLSLCLLNARYYDSNLEQSLKIEAYDYEGKYTTAIKEKINEYKKLEHDMKNHIIILNGLVSDSHVEEAKEYIKGINFDNEKYYVYIDHLVLNYLLNNKMKEAKGKGIDISCVILGTPLTFITDTDYSILVGNLLDNAIESAELTAHKKIKVSLSFYENKFVVEVKNSVLEKPKKNYFTTIKKDKINHGIGLKNIKDIVDKYNGQDIIEVKDQEFYHMCILYKVDE